MFDLICMFTYHVSFQVVDILLIFLFQKHIHLIHQRYIIYVVTSQYYVLCII